MIIHTNDPGVKFHAMYDPSMQKVALYMWKIDYQGRRYIPEPVDKMTESRPDGHYRSPLMALEPEDAQYLANALWEAGIRPVQSNGSSGGTWCCERASCICSNIKGQTSTFSE